VRFSAFNIVGTTRALESVLSFDPARCRAAVTACMAVYLPARTVQGIMEAAAALAVAPPGLGTRL
jgi:hypothetical protein